MLVCWGTQADGYAHWRGDQTSVTELLEHMDRAFGNVCEYDTMIRSLYEIGRKRESLWRSSCYKSMRLWQLSTVFTQTRSLIRGRI